VEEQLGRFISGNRALKAQYLERLKAMHASLASCALFSDHQFINTSLLFVHDVSAPRRAAPPSHPHPSHPLRRPRPPSHPRFRVLRHRRRGCSAAAFG